ncbi:ribonucleotide reductase of class Ia (aerobic), alpha subunit [Pseudomonas phage PSA11]|nr:ribonucleotide reductase of class Ia (aerobic), alpha subunit [Pseudomonas phage PSA11]
MTSIYEKLSQERKELQAQGLVPEWMTTGGWQLFKEKYLWEARGLKDTYERIAKTAARHTDDPDKWASKFFDVLWRGWLAASTPVLSNMGTIKGMPVSCSGQYIEDSIDGFYSAYHETAMLTKNGFGTSGYLGDIRPRGSVISTGGKASGTLPIFKHFVQDMRDVAQGTSRRGAWAGYLPIDHGDFYEIVDYLKNFPDDLNIGWNLSQAFIDRLEAGDVDAVQRFQRAMYVKAITGKGYFFKPDTVNAMNPQMYKDRGLEVKASNLCTEITLFSDEDHTFTCVLSSMNLEKYDEWKNTDAVFVSTVFLDCVAQEFIRLAKGQKGFEKSVRFTEASRALGLGALGFHTYLQAKMIPLESFEAHMTNLEIFQHLHEEATRATKWMAKAWGEPGWCKGYGVRNTHLLAIAPNTSSALICGGVSQGIEPVVANLYNQPTSAGEIYRVNPVFLNLAKKRVGWTDELVKDLIKSEGSVQHLDWLSPKEKAVFKTAYEVDQAALVRLAAARQPYICQAQSINLFFDANEREAYIAQIHKEALLNPQIKSLYYMRTKAGVQASKGECEACSG